VHRDVKPANVLLADDGPRLIDFGISRAADATALTQAGMVLGSPGFMSPEQAEGGVVGPASDVFSLGAVLAFAASGQGPFGTGSTPALVYRVVHREPDVTGLPGPIRPLVERCLAKDPRQRPAPGELLAQLGVGQRATDWVPEPFTQAVTRHVPATVTVAQSPVTVAPSPAATAEAGRRPPRRAGAVRPARPAGRSRLPPGRCRRDRAAAG
jgi:serine/threonine protein kinase